ncbi:MAG: hypothetical protein L3J52_08020 [Proteobacteria bacterium]|nr:hypothetical protein [Pseudomonadota bacterium]
MAKLLHNLGLDGNDVMDDFIYHYVNHAYQESKTKASVYLSTGFSRRIVDKYLNKNACYEKQKKRSLYFELLLNELKSLSEKYPDGWIPIRGTFGSYNSAFENTKPPDNIITAKAMLDNLVKAGMVELKDKKIRFLTSLQSKALNDVFHTIEALSNLMHRLCQTIQHNIDAETTEDTLYQMTYKSDTVLPEHRQKLTDELRILARKHSRKYQELIDSYKQTDLTKKEVEDLNNEIGISTFIFNNDNEE